MNKLKHAEPLENRIENSCLCNEIETCFPILVSSACKTLELSYLVSN